MHALTSTPQIGYDYGTFGTELTSLGMQVLLGLHELE